MIDSINVSISENEIADFCQQWKINEFALFGSVLRNDFNPDSDLDVLITFTSDAEWGLFDHVEMKEALSQLFNREIDLLTRNAVENSHNKMRRQEILDTAQVIYVTG